MHVTSDPAAIDPFHGCVCVPTMGALHDGHTALIRKARRIADEHDTSVLVTIFANPAQFAPNEDFDRYPRPLEADLAVCESLHADVVFNPSVETVYPDGPQAAPPPGLVIPDVALRPGLEEHTRPRFFPGVCRVVHRLFELAHPAHAVFGEKDYQQLLSIRAMVEAMNIPVRIHAGQTVRDADGLALSSRNVYLTPAERKRARGLHLALEQAAGQSTPADAQRIMRDTLEDHFLALDYAVVRDAQTLLPLEEYDRPARALIAAWVDEVRLIDNAPIGPH